ncbi:putative membrane protein [Mycobacterium ulcerans str. Harvey]|uniref:Membrane protein n=1 Tax=Mycobacterium ulcerans str. Harvey TaxID=1299332 RepID=A0ABN0RAH2_MYCUL|nr:putative membrane protein [Mycobacterium ulcerans str. Harvey]
MVLAAGYVAGFVGCVGGAMLGPSAGWCLADRLCRIGDHE